MPPIEVVRLVPPRPGQVIVIDMPGSGQAAVAVARSTIDRSDPRYYRALVANAVLGGGYSARLNQEIRIRRGLSYGSGSGIEARRRAGPVPRHDPDPQRRSGAGARARPRRDAAARRRADPGRRADRPARLADRRFRPRRRDHGRHRGPDRELCDPRPRARRDGPLSARGARRHPGRGAGGGRRAARAAGLDDRHRRRGLAVRRGASPRPCRT